MTFNRRQFLINTTITAGGIIATDILSQSRVFAQAPGIITADKMRPAIPYGVACGDISNNSIVIWSRCDRPARLVVEYSPDENFRRVRRVLGSYALEAVVYWVPTLWKQTTIQPGLT
jgi:alkaline phosphatase D